VVSKKSAVWFAVVIFILCNFILTCSPERDNPYDINSPNKKQSQIIGRVMTKVGNPIKSAQVSLIFQNIGKTIIVSSDSNGNYDLRYYYDIEQGDSAQISVTKSNYADYLQIIKIGINQFDTFNFLLNALPQFSAESITSQYEQLRPFPGDIFSVTFSVHVIDADGPGDIDSIVVSVPSLYYSIALNYDYNNNYKRTIQAEYLPGANLENLIGKDCYFIVYSKPDQQTISAPYQLTRIIYNVPEQVYPVEDTVSNNFNCVWSYFNAYFPFTYEVEVFYLSEINPVPISVFDTTGIVSSDTSIFVHKYLANGRYLWQVSLKDNFGNIGKSNRILFYIRP